MRLTRIFVEEDLASGRELTLPAGAAGHLSRVLRLGEGDPLILFDGRGGEYEGRILEMRWGKVRVQVGAHDPIERESRSEVVLAQGASRGERMDWVIEKATELGVRAIVPLLTDRSVVRLDDRQAEAKTARWRAVAIAACEQCGRNRIPEIATPVALGDWLGRTHEGTRMMLAIGATAPLAQAPREPKATLLIGPEGGLTEAEREKAARLGFQAYGLGPRILRTETAAVAALAMLQAVHGEC
jgi:16S rRNA (uracil1498-N3)-methyltransferase